MESHSVKIAPSVLSADFARFGEEVDAIVAAGCDLIHFDVMDGHFVPNITFGPPVIRKLRGRTDVPFDVHLMITEPDRYLAEFVDAGANIITVHAEACVHLHRTLQRIRELGCGAGVALNPATPLSAITHVADSVDLILVMTVNPGFGGQSFIEGMLRKVEAAGQLLHAKDLRDQVLLEVDGGVSVDNIAALTRAGATAMVSGSGIFGGGDYSRAIAAMRAQIDTVTSERPTRPLAPVAG